MSESLVIHVLWQLGLVEVVRCHYCNIYIGYRPNVQGAYTRFEYGEAHPCAYCYHENEMRPRRQAWLKKLKTPRYKPDWHKEGF